MADVLNLETESTPLNTQLENPELESVTELDEPLLESTLQHTAALEAGLGSIEAASVATDLDFRGSEPEAPESETHNAVAAGIENLETLVPSESVDGGPINAVTETSPAVAAAEQLHPVEAVHEEAAHTEASPIEPLIHQSPVEATSEVVSAPSLSVAVAEISSPKASEVVEAPAVPSKVSAPVPSSRPTPARAAERKAVTPVVANVAPTVEHDFDMGEDFSAQLEAFEREQAAEAAAVEAYGDSVVTGTIIKYTDKHAIIDVGLKSEGLLPIEQAVDHNGEPKFKAGDQVEVVIEREESEGGYLVSYDKAQRIRVWDVIEKAANEKTPMLGTVVSRVKGGLTVDIGLKAFLPGSQLEVRPVRNLDGYLGTQIEVRVIKLNKKRGNVVVSRKEILEEEQNAKRSTTLEHLEEGGILTGTVKNLTDYGAFVDLGGIDGLLHITDMSWGRLTHPRDLVNVGDEIQVKVLKFDKDKQRVSLGFKQLTPDPWLDAVERYPVGARVQGRILSVTDYGAFVELEQGIEGLVHVSEMTWSKRMKHPSKLVKPGDEVETIVISVNPSDRRISLGMKQLQENPWENLSERYPTGQIVEGRVRNLTDFGAFIEIEDGIDGLVHVSNLSWTKRVKHPSEILKKGEKVKAVVLGVEPENRRLSLGVKQLQPDVWETFFTQHRVNDVVHGKVLRTAQFGAFVEIAEGVEGLCHVSEAVDPSGQPLTLEQGQEHDFKIIKMNVDEKKVGLSIRAVGEEASRSEVEQYKSPSRDRDRDRGDRDSGSSSSSSSSTTTLGDLVNWDKFRR